MIKFTTETGSVYEVDASACRMRRLSGTHAPSTNQGEDSVWKNYGLISPVEAGSPVLVVWLVEPDDVNWKVRSTITSPVVDIERW